MSKDPGEQAVVVTLTEAIRSKAPDGGLFHARCTLADRRASSVRLTEGDETIEMSMEPEKIEGAKYLSATEVVATILRRTDGSWRTLALRTPDDFAHWHRNRGRDVTVDGMFREQRATFDLLIKTLSD